MRDAEEAEPAFLDPTAPEGKPLIYLKAASPPPRVTIGAGSKEGGTAAMRYLILATIALAIISCSAPHQIVDRSDFLAEATRTYKGETRERLIAAAETVLKQSDPADFEFRHTLNGFTGLRRYTVYAVVAASQGREKWEFAVEPEALDLRAAISVSEAGTSTGGGPPAHFENKLASVPLYRLFWNRVDYVLGRRPDWITCDQASEELRELNTNVLVALGGLCGPTSDGRYSPPPPQMEPLPPPVSTLPNGRQRAKVGGR